MAFWHPFADMGAVSKSELLIERGEGPWVFDADDNRYLDGTASLWYANLGHGRAEIADAVAAQMKRIEAYHTFSDLSNRPANELCDALAARAPKEAQIAFDRVYDAVPGEIAPKLALAVSAEYAGEYFAAARFYAKTVLPGIAMARKLIEDSDLDLMELPDDCW